MAGYVKKFLEEILYGHNGGINGRINGVRNGGIIQYGNIMRHYVAMNGVRETGASLFNSVSNSGCSRNSFIFHSAVLSKDSIIRASEYICDM
jgi:hypothetical protein